MIRKIIKSEHVEGGATYFPEGWWWFYLEGSHNIPDFAVSATQLEVMVFGC